MTQNLGANTDALTANQLTPLADSFFQRGHDGILKRDTCSIVSAQIADTVLLGTFKSTARITPGSSCWFGAFGTGVKLNIGDSVHPTGLSNQIDVSAAGTSSLWTSYVAGDLGMPLWQALGYASDPGGQITLLATFAAAASTVTKAFDWSLVGVDR